MWVSEGKKSFKDFLMWYNNKDVVLTLEAMQKMIEFYHQKEIDMLKFGCILPSLANNCLHKSTHSKFYPFTECEKDLLERIREDMVGGPSIVFTRKAVVDETFIRKSANLCKSIVGKDASQRNPCLMCQPMPTGLYTRWNYVSKSRKLKPRENKTGSYENMVLSYFQQTRPDCRYESNVTTGRQKKIDCFSVDGICKQCNAVFKAMGCCFHCCQCQEARPSLTDEILRGKKEKTRPNAQRIYPTERIKNHLRANFPFQRPLSEERLMLEIKSRRLFGHVQCDLKVPEHLKAYFANLTPIFQNTVVTPTFIILAFGS